MIAGHTMLAFAIVTWFVAWRGASRRRALALGIAAGAFATVPDVDMAYALVGLVQTGPAGVWTMTNAFWGSATEVHRTITHSFVLAVPAAVAFAAFAHRSRAVRATGIAVVVTMAAYVGTIDGGLAAAIASLFGVAGLGVAAVARRYDLTATDVLGVALFGLLSHPFGDTITGYPPGFFYPFDYQPMDGRIALAADPTIDFIAVFAVELATIWLAVWVVHWLYGERIRDRIEPRAGIGLGYAGAALLLPPPSLKLSYQFVYSVLAVGFVGAAPPRFRLRRWSDRDWTDAVVTGLAAVSLATAAFTVAYLVT